MEETRPNLEAIHSILTEDSGFEHFGDTLLLFVGGSALHGARLEGKHDLDLYGVYCESPAEQLGLRQSHLNEHGEKVYENTEHFVWSTAGDRRRNTADDVDVNLYGLQKWAGMAAGGDTNSIGFLFAQENLATCEEIWFEKIKLNRYLFLSKHAAYRYYHFAADQLSRLKGEKGMGKRGQREELVEKYGYDTKFAMHTIRILHEGIELMETGAITYPRPEKQLLIDIRLGKFGTIAELDEYAQVLFHELEEARVKSALPDEVDRKLVSDLVADVYLEVWGAK